MFSGGLLNQLRGAWGAAMETKHFYFCHQGPLLSVRLLRYAKAVGLHI